MSEWKLSHTSVVQKIVRQKTEEKKNNKQIIFYDKFI